MMRARTLIVLCVAAAFLLTGGSAFALTAAHQAGQTGYTNGGDCAACHIPHKAAGAKRGFPIEPTTAATYGYIGSFCFQRCHDGTVANADTSGSVLVNFAGGATGATAGSHGINLQNAGGNAPSSTVVASTLPYGNGTRTDAFECTTCHNVHANATGDTSDALLMEDIDTLCDTCHTNRGAGDGTWAGFGYANATGSHPVGTNITGDIYSAPNSPIVWGSVFTVAYDVSTSGSHNLGGHLIDGSAGMGCATCHAVHGSQPDADPPVATATYTEDLLASGATVGVTGTADPSLHATGAGEVNNSFCEGCHGLAVSKWNPGNTAGSHPVDAMYSATSPVSNDMGMINNPSGWPVGSATVHNNIGMNAAAGAPGARVICETCHTPHPNANINSGIANYLTTAANYMYSVDNGTTAISAVNTPLLRQATGGAAAAAQVCGYCHDQATPLNHHPVGRALGSGYAAGNIGDGDGTLECGDCHGGGLNAAHNWPAAQMPSLDSDWIPAGNGRTAEDAITTGVNAVANTSRTCTDCHLGGSTMPWPRFSPSRVTPGNGIAAYQNHGDGSHFLGAVAAGFDWTLGNIDGTAFDASDTTSTWNAKANSHSRFAGTTTNPELVCESCHEIQPTRNDAKPAAGTYNNLLLKYTYEGEAVAGTANLYRSQFCEGCHGHNPGVTGSAKSHPMTTDNVTKAFDMGRTPSTLITATTGYANASGAPADGTYPAANAMNCDSCHQVHDGPTGTGTWILDAAEAKVSAGTARAGSVALYGGTYSRTTIGAGTVQFQAFCTMCHVY